VSSTAVDRAAAGRYLWGLAVALAVVCVVALGEIDAQSGRVVGVQGRAWPFSVLVGPGFAERTAGWTEVLMPDGLISNELFRALLSWHLVIDTIFVITYGCLLAGLATGHPAPLLRLLDARPIRNLGLSSYSLYLTHGPIVVVVYERVVAGRVRQGVPAFVVLLILVVPLTIGFARVFSSVFETPFQRRRSWAWRGTGLLGHSSWNRGERA